MPASKRKPAAKSKRPPRRKSPRAGTDVASEMVRAAAILHDGLSQTLNGALFFAHNLVSKAKREKLQSTAEKELLKILTRAVQEARELHKSLQPGAKPKRARSGKKAPR